MSLCFRSFEKEIQNKKRKKLFFKVRKDTILLRRYLLWEYFMDVAGLTTYVNPSWCHFRTVISRSFRNWLNAVHDDDKAAIINGWQNATTINEKLMSEYRFMRPDGKIAGSWGNLFLS
jgi:hypothetical protein